MSEMINKFILIHFVVSKNPRSPYQEILEDGTTKIVIEVTQDEMDMIIIPNIKKAYEENSE